jgi:acetyl-CoA acetyltransferase
MARHAYGKPWGDRVAARYAAEGGLLPDGVRADELARLHAIERGAQDAWAHRSHSYARAASARIVPQLVAVDTGYARAERDERTTKDIGDIAEISPMFDEAGTVTAANRANIGDGAVAIVVMARRRANELGIGALCRIRGTGSAARGPRDLAPATMTAVARALTNAGIATDDLDRIELHEDTAATVLHIIEQCGFTPDRVNRDGGSIAIGHPTGATGGRLITSLAHGLGARGSVGLAVVEGEDIALATVLQR